MNSKFLIFWLFLLFFSACSGKGNESDASIHLPSEIGPEREDSSNAAVPLKDTVFYFPNEKDSLKVEIKVPKVVKGYVLFLHGWNLLPEEMCVKTDFCRKFLDSGYVLVLPNFGKTTYQWENYPQTKKSYLKYPTRRWITDTFLLHLQKEFNILIAGENNFVFGVSTGGRGAALLALENPTIFKAAACLSADFDHSQLPNEPINNGYYGSIKLYPERWTGKDNIHNRAKEFQTGLFLAHGEKDKICPVSQTVNFQSELIKTGMKKPLKTVIDPKGDHTYQWWNQQISPVIDFFGQF